MRHTTRNMRQDIMLNDKNNKDMETNQILNLTFSGLVFKLMEIQKQCQSYSVISDLINNVADIAQRLEGNGATRDWKLYWGIQETATTICDTESQIKEWAQSWVEHGEPAPVACLYIFHHKEDNTFSIETI